MIRNACVSLGCSLFFGVATFSHFLPAVFYSSIASYCSRGVMLLYSIYLFFPVSSFCLFHSVLFLYFLRCKPCDHNFPFKFMYPLFICSLFPLNCLSFFVLIIFYRCYVFRLCHKYTNTSDYVHVYRVAHDNPLPP